MPRYNIGDLTVLAGKKNKIKNILRYRDLMAIQFLKATSQGMPSNYKGEFSFRS